VLDEPISVNFLRYRPGNRMRIPVEFINADQSVDLRRGSFLTRVNRYVECICDNGVPIPQNLMIDLTGVMKGEVIRVGSLKLPPGVRPAPSVPGDFVLGVIKSSKSK
jgi:Ribosomal protein TL5, C-terminal domain